MWKVKHIKGRPTGLPLISIDPNRCVIFQVLDEVILQEIQNLLCYVLHSETQGVVEFVSKTKSFSLTSDPI